VRTTLAVLALTLLLAGCGDSDDDEIRSGGADETPSSSAQPTTETDQPDGEVEVCELATEADVEAAFGEDLPAGSFSSGSTDEDGVQWQSDNCNWDVEDGLEVQLAYSTAEDFADGELLCPELDSFDTPSTPVEGLDAVSASWVVDQIDPEEGTLRICTESALVNIDTEYADGTADPATMQEQSVALAEVVLANLG
jgi:hypothetical protein